MRNGDVWLEIKTRQKKKHWDGNFVDIVMVKWCFNLLIIIRYLLFIFRTIFQCCFFCKMVSEEYQYIQKNERNLESKTWCVWLNVILCNIPLRIWWSSQASCSANGFILSPALPSLQQTNSMKWFNVRTNHSSLKQNMLLVNTKIFHL
jgi:hypothetical protein